MCAGWDGGERERICLRVSVGSKGAVAAKNLFIKSKMSTDNFRDEAT